MLFNMSLEYKLSSRVPNQQTKLAPYTPKSMMPGGSKNPREYEVQNGILHQAKKTQKFPHVLQEKFANNLFENSFTDLVESKTLTNASELAEIDMSVFTDRPTETYHIKAMPQTTRSSQARFRDFSRDQKNDPFHNQFILQQNSEDKL